MTHARSWRRRGRARPWASRRRRLATQNGVFLAFGHTLRGKGVRLPLGSPALCQAGALALRAIRRDELRVHVAGGWVLLPTPLASLLSALTFVLGDGCDGVEPGVNVLMSTDDAGGLVLQVVDPILGVQDQACSMLHHERLGSEPCGKNPTGECDMAWS